MSRGRRRVGVVAVIDPPAGAWVDGLRRAVGDGSMGRIGPHITLVPPLNLRPADLDAALDRLAGAAASVPGPVRLTLGPPATFAPANPVLYLAVGGEVEDLRRLRDSVFAPPLERTLTWPWVPHVTLCDDVDDARAGAVCEHLDRFAAAVDIERVTILEESHHGGARRWEPLADVCLGPVAVVGRGGLELRLVTGRTPEPFSAGLLGDWPAGRLPPAARLVVAARREGATVGAAAAWRDDDGGHVRVVVAPAARGGGVGSHLLAGVEDAVRRHGWRCATLAAEGPDGFYRSRSSFSVAAASQ